MHADELYGQKTLSERAFPATAIHQTFRGSGFVQKGGAQARGRTGIPMRSASRTHNFSSENYLQREEDFRVLAEVSEDNEDMYHMLEEGHRDELLHQEQRLVGVDVYRLSVITVNKKGINLVCVLSMVVCSKVNAIIVGSGDTKPDHARRNKHMFPPMSTRERKMDTRIINTVTTMMFTTKRKRSVRPIVSMGFIV